ncbi:membrane protein insertion efficiency factor YidD [Marinigracilibium pacificum]|uniref:Putative membrane protein insertion efficiency factor n=1 Tax=Marinigracilibium pacificum TaxID=2729599 RepID=A0A848IXE9_9BACT|nr:membrane protein insertion efficiency factor YidD [Marinigracilibium pacificum]NMM46924.1 membrane protein insertion efficiency factor YidD [Marinigracilibium pacificum]
MRFINILFSKLFIGLTYIYKGMISPFIPGACRYSPSCSTYMIKAVQTHGPWKGVWLGLKRISRCHPWGGSGHDPVPPKEN